MNMGQVLLGLFLAYLLYNFIFRFIIPLVRVTRQVKRQVRDFQQQVNTNGGGFDSTHSTGGFPGAQSGHYQAGGINADDFQTDSRRRAGTTATGSATTKPEPRSKKDDYIDFEEIK